MVHRLLLLEVANFKVVAGLAAAAMAAVTVAVARRRHVAALLMCAATLGTATAADAVNTHFGYLPQVADVLGVSDWPTVPAMQVLEPSTTPRPRGDGGHHDGAVIGIVVNGTHSGFGDHRVLVALPPEYFTTTSRRFPVVYLLHGSPGRPEDWLRAGRLMRIAHHATATPIIFVMPPMSRGWLDDSECVDGIHENVDTWLARDVVPTIDRQLRTFADRGDRALMGNSAGGYCALNLALRHSATFADAVDMSGYAEPTHDGGLRHLFGTSWRAGAAANTPAVYLQGNRCTLPMNIRMDVGRSDRRPMDDAQALRPLLTSYGITASVVVRDGGHTFHVWRPGLRDGIAWLGQLFDAARPPLPPTSGSS